MSEEFHHIHHSIYIGDLLKTTQLLSLNCWNGTLGQAVVRMRNMKMDAVLSKVPKGGQLGCNKLRNDGLSSSRRSKRLRGNSNAFDFDSLSKGGF